MSQQNLAILTLSVVASGAVAASRFVTVAGAQAGAAANTLGVARYGVASGAALAVDVLGTTVAEAGAAVSAGAALETDTNGKAITKTTGPTVGRALQAATGAGQFIEVLLIAN